MFIDDEYLPEYGILVLRDAYRGGEDPEPPEGGEQLNDGALDLLAGGTVAGAGFGWLHGNASDGYHRVILESHDAAPPPERAPWTDVVETGYLSPSGFVGLTLLTGASIDEGLDLGGPGDFRVRVSRRNAEDEGLLWRLQFWRAAPEPPRWLVRSRPVDPADTYFRTDLTLLAGWSELTGSRWTLQGLAERLGTERTVVLDGLEAATDKGGVSVVGDLLREFSLTTSPPPSVSYTSGVVPLPEAGAPWNSPAYRPPMGPPPRAGILGHDGTLTRWVNGEPATCPTVPNPQRALETPHGVVVIGADTVLVRPDGSLLDLGSGHLPGTVRLEPDGRHLTVEEHHIGRQSYRRRHHLDLADGSRHLEWLPEYEWPTAVTQTDYRSGLVLTATARDEIVLTGPGGLRRELWLPSTTRLAVGGAGLFTTTYAPTAITWFDLAEADPSGVVRWLPTRAQVDRGLVWETPSTVIIAIDLSDRHLVGAGLLRVDLPAGTYEAVPGEAAVVVEPWFTVN